MYMTSPTVVLPNATNSLNLHASEFFPTPSEERSLRCSLEEQEKSIQTLNIQIASLEALVAELLTRRVILVESSNMQKALLSPIRKLAPELLGEIFEYCMPRADDGPSPITEDSAPLVLGQVCKRWRRVASGTPRLWTTINCGPQTTANPLAVIPTWLENSGSLLIDIFLGEGLERLFNSKNHASAFKSCLKMLNAHFHRCRTFHGTNSTIMSTLFPMNHRTNASSLRDFSITPSPTVDLPLVIGEIAAPNLETMDVSQPYTFFDSITTDHTRLRTFRWDSSVSFPVNQRYLQALSEVLTLRSNLEECHLNLPSKHLDLSVGDATVTLSRLRRLSLAFPMTTDPGDLLSIIDAPALEYLSLEQISPITRGPDISRALRCLVSATSSLLREIHLTRMIFSSQDVIVAPFTPLSNVESLNFHHCFVHSPFLAALTPNPDDSPDLWTLPKLSSLSLRDSGVPTDDLIHMIEARLACGPSHKPLLSSISLSNCRISSSGRDALRKLAETHVDLRIHVAENSW